MTARSTRRPRGRPPYPGDVTPAEQRVLDGLRRQLTYQEIADELGLSYDTVKYHVSNMLSKAGVDSREDLVVWASDRPGIVARLLAVPLAARIAMAAGAVGAVGAGAMLVAAALSDSTPQPSTADESPPPATVILTPTAPPPPVLTPATLTAVPVAGVPIVDQVIEAVLSGDAARVEALVDYADCTFQSPQPPEIAQFCPGGITEGTPVLNVIVSNCYGYFATEADIARALPDWLPKWRTVFSASRSHGYERYRVVFTGDPQSGQGGSVWLSDEGIISIYDGCVPLLSMSGGDSDFLITPRSGIPALDGVIEHALTGNVLGIRDRLVTQAVPCTLDPWIGEGLGCPEGVRAGTPLEAIRYVRCGRESWVHPEDTFGWRGDAGRDAETTPAILPSRVHSVSRGRPTDTFEYWLVLEGVQGSGAAFGVDADGRISIHGVCSRAPQLVPADADFILPPE